MIAETSILHSARLVLVGETDWLDTFEATLETHSDGEVVRTRTTQETQEAANGKPLVCVVSEYELTEEDCPEVIREFRAEADTLPVVVATSEGSERAASEVLRAGATDYVAIDDIETQREEVLGRIERAIRNARRSETRRERARQFDAMFHDRRTARWVLGPDGEIRRVNQTARQLVDQAVDQVVGTPFWTLPWWSEADDIRVLVDRAREGEFASAVVFQAPLGNGRDSTRVVDLSIRPVRDERGVVVSLVVDCADITDRVELERELRESERLHRVTLNNMTDTVLITDGDGEYTYVCPNVHFIFGYTAEEIRELGTIENLLGEDLFDREELAERGVLKNIECTATDKAGREHTLLVNVREVDIQGGTLLYSCRDITKRKQREQALATLQETAREFLYAETHQEIVNRVVEDTPDVLDVDASGVYLFDADTNELVPAAHSQAMREYHGPLPTVPADGETLPSHSFLEDEPLFFADVHDAALLSNPATELRSVAYIPLGDHGVFVAGTDRVDAFDAVRRELADLLAVTAEAALDRVRRESQLREQDRTLKRQNEQLTRLNRINETIREIDRALVGAETQSEIDQAVCEQLTVDDRFAFAWVGTVNPATETVEPRAWAGSEQGYLDEQLFPVRADSVEPAGRAAATGEISIVQNVAAGLRDEPWRKEALVRDYLSVLSIPLVYNDLTHGVLTVYSDSRDAFDETAREVLVELGGTIASALSALERKHALLTTALTRIEVDVEDTAFVLSRLAREADATLSYQGGVQPTSDGSYVFLAVEDGDLEAVTRTAREFAMVSNVDRVSEREDGGVLRLRLAGAFLALELAEHGAILREVTARPEGTTLVVDVPERIDTHSVTQLLEERFESVTLRSKQSIENAVSDGRYTGFLDELTDRQLEVLQTAYYSGFFESPRESTGEDVAAMLDISPPAFYQHVRTVQRKLFATLFEEHSLPTASEAADVER